jgi:hypothetical protein
MQIDTSIALQILVNLGGLAAIYTGLKVQIAVIATKVNYIERRLKMNVTQPGNL